MPHQQLHEVCREIAEKETRFLIFQENYKDLPKGEYGFVELYCNDSKCDCRNVYIQVINPEHTEPLTTISYGRESLKFYKDWMRGDADDIIHEFKGPALTFAKHSKYADTLLELFTEVINADVSYVERLKRHYRLFKNEIEKKAFRKTGKFKHLKLVETILVFVGVGESIKNVVGNRLSFTKSKSERLHMQEHISG